MWLLQRLLRNSGAETGRTFSSLSNSFIIILYRISMNQNKVYNALFYLFKHYAFYLLYIFVPSQNSVFVEPLILQNPLISRVDQDR